MRKIILFLTLFLASCLEEKKNEVEAHNDFMEAKPDFTEKRPVKTFTQCPVQMLIPDTYRVDKNDDPTLKMNKNWFDLYKKGSKYYLKRLEFTINKGLDECSGYDTKEIETPNYSLMFIDYKHLNKGRIAHLIPSQKVLHPNDIITLHYYGVTYKIRCEAEVKKSNLNECFSSYKNYRLYLKVNETEELLFSQDEFNDTQTEIEFVGDIDGDYKLDFILNSPTWYEENRKVLFLSSQAKNKRYSKKVAECSVQHDC